MLCRRSFASSGLTDCQKKELDVILAGHNTLSCWGAGNGKSFLMKQISECTTKAVYVTSTTSYSAAELFFKTFATLCTRVTKPAF